MELFETEVGSADSKILKEPTAFVEEFKSKMSPDQVSTAFGMFVCRGDIMVGLGANKRAVTEFTCAAVLKPDDAECAGKLAQIRDDTSNPSKKTKLQEADTKIPC